MSEYQEVYVVVNTEGVEQVFFDADDAYRYSTMGDMQVETWKVVPQGVNPFDIPQEGKGSLAGS